MIQKYTTVENVAHHIDKLGRGVSVKIKPELDRLLSNLRFLKIDTELAVNVRTIDDPNFTFNREYLYEVKTN